MKQTRLLFIDRDGTLIQEPEDEQIDSFEKLVFTKGVFRNLAFIAQHTDDELVMVRSIMPCLPICSSMWSKNPRPVVMSHLPEPSRFTRM